MMKCSFVLAIAFALASAAVTRTNASPTTSQADRLCLRGYDLAYNLDFPEALATFQEAIAAQPRDPQAYRRNEQEEVLSLDPRRKDAGLIVGTYRYIVASLPLPIRLMAYVVGFGGGRERGLRMIEEAATYPGDSQVDAKFALVLLYNRERRFDQALKIVRELQARFPRNRAAVKLGEKDNDPDGVEQAKALIRTPCRKR
jgi:tetratricopeptide (TPR) repeat protein